MSLRLRLVPLFEQKYPLLFNCQQSSVWWAHFCDELGGLLRSGIPLAQALRILAGSDKTGSARQQVGRQLSERVFSGAPLSCALAQVVSVPVQAVAMVQQGERGGQLGEALQRWARQQLTETERQRQWRSRLVYPCTVLAAVIVTIVMMWSFVIPQLESLLLAQEQLPMTTRVLLICSRWWRSGGAFISGVVMIGVLACLWWCRHRDSTGYIAMSTVLPWYRDRLNARWLEDIGCLMSDGVPLLQSLSAVFSQRTPQAQIVFSIAERVSCGWTLAQASALEGELPERWGVVVEAAERRGQLAKGLLAAACGMRMEAEQRLERWLAWMEPVLLFGLAALVGIVVWGILVPLVDLEALGGSTR